MKLTWLVILNGIWGKTTRRKRLPEVRYRQIQLPEDILNFAQSDDPNLDRERRNLGDGECPADNPSMCGFDPSKFTSHTRCFTFELQSVNLARHYVLRNT